MMKAYAQISAGQARSALRNYQGTGSGNANRRMERAAQRMLTDNQARQSANRQARMRRGANR